VGGCEGLQLHWIVAVSTGVGWRRGGALGLLGLHLLAGSRVGVKGAVLDN
jgi:hypothetical protein